MSRTLDAAALAAEREVRLAVAHGRLTRAVMELTSSYGWQRMLTLAARLPTYSANNVLLISVQRPDSTRVAGYRTWRDHGRHVRKGETGIAILAPCLYRPDRDREQPSGEEAQEPQRQLCGFRVVHVFDITQTDGEPLLEVGPVELRGAAPANLWRHLAGLAHADGYSIERGPCHGAYGFTRFDDRTIRIRDDIDDAHAVKTLAHELGHIRADHEHRYLDTYHRSPACRGAAEIEAESIAYLTTATSGLNSIEYSAPYLAGWANGNTTLLHDTATRVLKIAAELATAREAAPRHPPAREASITPTSATSIAVIGGRNRPL